MDTRNPGRTGYEAYAKSTGGKTYDGRDMPTWEQVQERTPHVAKAWEDAAKAIEAERDLRWVETDVIIDTRPIRDGKLEVRCVCARCGVMTFTVMSPAERSAVTDDELWPEFRSQLLNSGCPHKR